MASARGLTQIWFTPLHDAAPGRSTGAAAGVSPQPLEDLERQDAGRGRLGVDVKVILTPPCIFGTENH
jgi:hypothetical protein